MKQKNNKIKLFLLAIFLGLFLDVSVSKATINEQINYQGKLTDDAGVSVPDGNYNMIISIYDAVSGGNCLWTARGTCGTPTARSVAVLNGIFSIMLGDTSSGDTALTGLDFNAPYFLGVTVGADAEMTPRKSIGASGYAFNSGLLNGLSSATSGADAHILATDSSGNATVSGDTYFNGITYYINSSGTGNLNGLTLAGDIAVNGNDITSTGALTMTPGAGTNFNVSLSGTGDFAVNTNQFYVDTSTARIGIGNTSPSVALHIGTTAPTNLGSTADSVMVSGALEVAGSAYLGPMQFPTDSGAISWIDMPVSASATPNAVESYSARLGGTDILTIYGQALGSGIGGIINPRVGISTTSPTAYLHIKAGTATAGTAPLKFTSGTNLTTAEAGAMEWDGTNLYITQTSGPTRKTIAYTDSVLTGTFDGINLATGTQGGVGYFSSTTQLSSGALGTTGQALISGGTGAPTWYVPTAGSLLFAGTSGVLAQDNANLFWDNTNKRLGIGMVSPTAKMHINAPVASAVTNPEQFRIEDGATGGYFSIAEWGSGASIYLPSFNFQSVGVNGVGGGFNGSIPVVNDVNASTLGAIILEGKRVGGAALTAANILNVRNNGTSVMVVDSSGRLGIGTTSPTAYLHIKAGTATAGTAPLKFTSGTNLTTAEAGAMEWDGTNLYITQTSGPTRKTIAYTDSVLTGTFDGINLATGTQGGVGYFSSTTQLSSGALGTTGQALISGGTGAPTWYVPTAGSLLFAGTSGVLAQDNANLFWDNTNKRLGIGTVSPDVKLEVVISSIGDGIHLVGNTTGTLSPILKFFDSTTLRGALGLAEGAGHISSDASVGDIVLKADTGKLLLQTGGTSSSMAISSGSIGIGTASPSAQLHTTGTVRFESLGAGTLVTDASGNVSVSSDERLKNIDENFNRGIEDLMEINPISFHWKKSTGMDAENSYIGFSAQNIQRYIPEAVGIDPRGFLTLSDRPILATMVNSVKGQQTQLEGITESVSELSNVNQDLILKTDENILTIADLQKSIDKNLEKISDSQSSTSEQITSQIQNIESLQLQTVNHEDRIKSIEDMLVVLQDKMADFQEVSNQELILAQMDLNKTDIDYMKMILGLDGTGEPGDIKMGGQLEARGVVAGAFAIKNIDEKSKTIGTATIKAGEKLVSVKTEAINSDSKIFVTPDQAIGVGVISVKNGEGFEIEASDLVENDLEVNWWVVEKK